jgi:Uma2 family endonuclease
MAGVQKKALFLSKILFIMGDLSLADQILERPDAILQLQSLTRALEAEKKRRQDFYEWVTEDVKAEFINGQVIIHSPVKKRHWNVTDLLSRLMSFYASLKQLGRVGTEKVMIALTRNDYEADLVFFSKEKADTFTDDQVLFPAPDFAVEILSKSTAAVDRNIKKADYAAHGVREYWIVDPVKQRIEQYILPFASTEYFPAKILQSGEMIQSIVLPGFEIPVMAIFDEGANLEALKGLMG